jgi:hypothetical protein
MTDEEYTQTQAQLILIAQLASQLDLDGFLERINQAETLAPILDPTLYMRGGQKLSQVKRLAQSLRPFQAEIRKQIKSE